MMMIIIIIIDAVQDPGLHDLEVVVIIINDQDLCVRARAHV